MSSDDDESDGLFDMSEKADVITSPSTAASANVTRAKKRRRVIVDETDESGDDDDDDDAMGGTGAGAGAGASIFDDYQFEDADKDLNQTWTCEQCKYDNDPRSTKCEICGFDHARALGGGGGGDEDAEQEAPAAAASAADVPRAPPEDWTYQCDHCGTWAPKVDQRHRGGGSSQEQHRNEHWRGAGKARGCGECRLVWYCGQACRDQHWRKHRPCACGCAPRERNCGGCEGGCGGGSCWWWPPKIYRSTRANPTRRTTAPHPSRR